jgi:hypothetical protein
MAPAPVAPNYNNAPAYSPAVTSNTYANNGVEGDIFTSIEKLATLQSRGILTEQEFITKKAELLSRL